MTKRQQQCLAFITAYIGEHGIAPSYEEIGVGLSLKSKSGVSRVIYELVDRGLLVFEGGYAGRGRSRCLRVPSEGSDYQRGYRDGFAAGQVKQAGLVEA